MSGTLPGGCLVLAAADAPKPTALLKALASRGMTVRLVHDEPSVMSMLAERPTGRRVLVVVEPGRWERLAELICAVHAYYGGVYCWQYTARNDGRPHLTSLDQRFHGPGPNPGVTTRGAEGQDASSDEPVGRIVGRRRPIDALLTRVPGRPLSTREVVTQQELTMLLGPVPGEAG